MAESISKDQLKQEQDQFVIIDVRESDEITNGVINNSQNMPLGLVIRNAKKVKLKTSKKRKFVYIVHLVIVETLQLMN